MILAIAILAYAVLGWTAYWCGYADAMAESAEIERMRAPVERVRGEPCS